MLKVVGMQTKKFDELLMGNFLKLLLTTVRNINKYLLRVKHLKLMRI